MKNLLLFLSFITFNISFSQFLDHNNVKAHTGNVPGTIFREFDEALGVYFPGYRVPKTNLASAIYAASLWCAATDANGQLHLAAMRFGQIGNDFFNGPYSSTNAYNDSIYISAYSNPGSPWNKSWNVTKSEIQNHISNYWQTGYVMPQDIQNWPANGEGGIGVAQNLAPFVDNNNNGIYEPNLGEYPDIRGDVASYMIMNDAAGVHTETGGASLGIEVHTMIYQFASNDYLDNTTFINYRVFNRGTASYSNFKVALWADFDLGNGSDDYIGCDVTNNMMYVYNGDNDDDGVYVYGPNPPAVGIQSLNKNMEYFTNGASFPYTDPSTAAQYFNFMNGQWSNGSPMYYGGTGATGSIPTNYMFPGDSDPTHIGTGGVDPGFFWDEGSSGNPPGDRRGVMTVEEVVLNSGDEECYDFAVLYSREPGNDNLQNVSSLRTIAAQAKIDYDLITTYNCNQVTLGQKELNESQIGLFPNPTNGSFTISFGNELISGAIIVTDMSGRIVLREEIKNKNVKFLSLDTKTGVYNVSIKTEIQTIHKKLIITE